MRHTRVLGYQYADDGHFLYSLRSTFFSNRRYKDVTAISCCGVGPYLGDTSMSLQGNSVEVFRIPLAVLLGMGEGLLPP